MKKHRMALLFGDRRPAGIVSLVRLADGKALAHGLTDAALAKLREYFSGTGTPCEIRKRARKAAV